MKSLFNNLLIIFILLFTLTATIANAQAAPDKDVPTGAAKAAPVDESTVIFPGCRLSGLLIDGDKTASGVPLNETQLKDTNIGVGKKSTYIKDCISSIIRFIIIIASLAAILKIAASGLAMMDPTGSKLGNKLSSRKTITNLVIGLFLLIVGWNIIPILNASFNNVNFLNLPGLDHCNVPNSDCTTPESIAGKEYKAALDAYIYAEKADASKNKKAERFGGEDGEAKKYAASILKYCTDKGNAKFKEEFTKQDILKAEYTKVCEKKGNIEAELLAWAKSERADKISKDGKKDGNPDSAVAEYTLAAEEYKKIQKDTKKVEAEKKLDLKRLEDNMVSMCVPENYEKQTSDKGKQFVADCKKLTDEKTKQAYLDSLK